MKFLLAGASGFLGTALRVRLAEEGYEVNRLVRREPADSAEFGWDPDRSEIDGAAFDGVDVVVNLCGAGIADRRWTPARRELLLSSRINPSALLAATLVELSQSRSRVPALIQASGVAFYGTGEPPSTGSGSEAYTEDSPAGHDFLAQLVLQWERAAAPAEDAGVRVVHLRTSPVMSRSGGPLQLMRIPWALGLGAKLGDGKQRMPLISLEDYVGVVLWAAREERARGPYNLTLPEPTTNADFSDVLAAELDRPRFLGAPAGVVRLVLGELADQLLGDLPVVPLRLLSDGYRFKHPEVRTAIAAGLDG